MTRYRTAGLAFREGLAPQVLPADCADDSDTLVTNPTTRGTQVVSPPQRKRRRFRFYNAVRLWEMQAAASSRLLTSTKPVVGTAPAACRQCASPSETRHSTSWACRWRKQ